MKQKKKLGRKVISYLLALVMVFSTMTGIVPGMSLTAYATPPTETLLTTITATGTEQASYSMANVATVSFSYTAYGSSAYLANWGWWGYGWSATVNAAEGYTITKCVFYDDQNRTATDSEAPFVVETTEGDKTPQVNGTPILAFTSKGIKKIEVYGYPTSAHTHSFTYTAGTGDNANTITATCSGEGDCDITEGLTLTISAPTGDLTADGMKTFPATLSTGYNTTAFPGEYSISYTKDGAAFDGTPTEAGEYTASVTVGEATASVDYEIAAPPESPYTSLVNTTNSVKFNNMDWYIIADNSTAVDAGTVTLLSKNLIGNSKFNSQSSAGNLYGSSTIKSYLDNLTAQSGSFYDVSSAIVDVDLEDVNVTGAKLWLLSTSEANGVDAEVRKCSANWWLRSPSPVGSAEANKKAMFIDGGNGGFPGDDNNLPYVDMSLGVRPALKLDLSKVIFDSTTNTFVEVKAPVFYQAWNGTAVADVEGGCTSYTVLTNQTSWTDGTTYVVNADTIISDRITVNGTVNLILCDGATLIARKGITVTSGNTLNIYAGSIDETILGTGKLYAGTINGIISTCEGEYAGIGGSNDIGGGTVTIHGGEVTALGNTKASGIGGGNGGAGGTVTIYGGTVTASGDGQGKGIGAGQSGSGNGTLTLGTGMYLYGGTSANPETDLNNNVKLSDGDYARYQYMTVNNVAPHTHSFTYTVGTGDDTNTITATCTGDGDCDYKTTGITLTLNGQMSSADIKYDGNAKEASISGYPETAPTGLAAKPTIVYYKSTGVRSTTPTGDALTGAPTDVGNYVAQMTWGGQTVSVPIMIISASLTNVSVTQNGTLTYTGNAQTPVVTTSATSVNDQAVTFKYSKTNDGTYGDMPTVTNVSDCGILHYIASAPNHNDKKGSIYLVMNKASQDAPAAPTKASATINSITLTSHEGYEYKYGGGEGEWQTSPTFTGLTMNTEYTFYQRVAEDENHNASPSSEGTTISTADHVHEWSYTAEGAVLTATCADTDTGHGEVKTATLTIVAPTLTTYGGTGSANATITGSIDGVANPTIVYKKGNDTLEAAPTDAGTYTANITLGTATATVEYTIAKASGSISYATSTVSKKYGDAAFTNELTIIGDGAVSYSSDKTSVATVNDSGKVTIVGAGGPVTITATVTDGNNYTYATKTATYTLTVDKADITPSVSIEGWTYGSAAKTPTVSGNTGSGSVTYTYAVKGTDEFAATVPTEKGDYTVKATIAATDNYKDATATADFNICQATTNTVTVSIEGWTYGDTAKAPSATATYGATNATFTYSDKADGTYTVTVPTKAGTHYVKANVAETANYVGGVSDPVEFTIAKKTVELTWGTNDFTYNGTEQLPTASIKSGVLTSDECSVEVSGAKTDVNTGTEVYTATASLSGDDADNYEISEADKTKVFTIKAKAMTVSADDVSVTYDGNAHGINVVVTEPEGATVTYKKTGDNAYSSSNPTFKDVGVYEVAYKVEKVNYTTFEGTATVKIAKAAQAAPAETFTTTKATGANVADGKISGFAATKAYQISSDDGTTWTDVTAESTSLDVKPGTYQIRYAGDKNHDAGASVNVTVEAKAEQSKPEGLSTVNVSAEDAKDGQVKGVNSAMEYSTDGGSTWTPVADGADKIDGLAKGDVQVRYAGTDDKNPSSAETVVIGVASKTEGVVEFKPETGGTEAEEKAVTGVEPESTKASVAEFAETQQEEGKDVKVALEITPQKEDDVVKESVEETNKVVEEVFAGIDSTKVVTEYLAIDVAKYVDNVKEDDSISDTKSPLEIALKFDNKKNNPLVVRTHDGKAKAFGKLKSRPEKKDYRDGMFYVDLTHSILYIYSQFFSDFAIVYATETTYNVGFVSGTDDSVSPLVVSDGGKITLPTGLTKTGFAFDGWYKDEAFSAAWKDSDTVSSDITLYAKWNKSVSGVSVTPAEVKFTKAGETKQVNVTVTPSDAINKKVTYKSSDTKVATIDANGKITAVANGTATITITTEDGAKTATVKVTVAIPEVKPQGTSEQPKTEQPKTEQPVAEPTKEEKAEISMNAGLKITQTGKKISIEWGKVKEADGYDVYVAYCGKKYGSPIKNVSKNTITKVTVGKIKGKKIDLKKNFKVYVAAYKMVDGQKEILAKSITGHVVGIKNKKFTNAKKITISKKKYTVKVGKTAKIKAKTVLVDKKKKQLSNAHATEFRYASSNKNIATVDKNGKVKGVAAGTCKIYVYSRNGLAKTVSVTVK